MSRSGVLQAALESTDFDVRGVDVVRLRGRERISQPFWFEVEVALRERQALPDDAAPGAAVTLILTREDHGEVTELRRVHGVIESVRDRLDAHRERRVYVLRVVPALSRLRLVETQEIFLGMNVPEIIRQKLDLHDLADTLVMHAEDYPKRELVVQYKESDLAFVSRLAEHVGVSFVFEHAPDEASRELCRVIFTDDVVNRGLTNGPQEIAYATEGEHLDVYELEVERRMVPSGYMVQDYNYRTPLAEITGSDQLEVGCGGGVIEFGAHHKNKIEGDRLATVRAQERQSGYEVYSGKSSLATLTAGATPVLTGHPILDDTRLLVVEVEHDATFAAFEQGGKPGEGAYKNQFQAIRADVHYRPPRVTPRPRIYGLVTGIVQPTHDVGGLARIDEEGRYSVQLYFDTVTHEGEEKASHPIRMAQPFAGPNHGMHFPLRPGAEVVIAFMDGDPDRPIIVGSVPNAVARAAVTAADSKMNRIHGTSGIVIEFSQGK